MPDPLFRNPFARRNKSPRQPPAGADPGQWWAAWSAGDQATLDRLYQEGKDQPMISPRVDRPMISPRARDEYDPRYDVPPPPAQPTRESTNPYGARAPGQFDVGDEQQISGPNPNRYETSTGAEELPHVTFTEKQIKAAMGEGEKPVGQPSNKPSPADVRARRLADMGVDNEAIKKLPLFAQAIWEKAAATGVFDIDTLGRDSSKDLRSDFTNFMSETFAGKPKLITPKGIEVSSAAELFTYPPGTTSPLARELWDKQANAIWDAHIHSMSAWRTNLVSGMGVLLGNKQAEFETVMKFVDSTLDRMSKDEAGIAERALRVQIARDENTTSMAVVTQAGKNAIDLADRQHENWLKQRQYVFEGKDAEFNLQKSVAEGNLAESARHNAKLEDIARDQANAVIEGQKWSRLMDLLQNGGINLFTLALAGPEAAESLFSTTLKGAGVPVGQEAGLRMQGAGPIAAAQRFRGMSAGNYGKLPVPSAQQLSSASPSEIAQWSAAYAAEGRDFRAEFANLLPESSPADVVRRRK